MLYPSIQQTQIKLFFKFMLLIFIGPFRGAFIQIEWCGFGSPGSAPGGGLNLLYMQVEKIKRKNKYTAVSWKTPVLKWLLLVAVHCWSRPMASLHSSVLTRILGQKLQVPRILRAAQYSAQQWSAVQCQASWVSPCWLLCLVCRKKEKQPIWRAEHSAISVSVS